MPTATMTSKGQITVPKEVRDELNLEPGSRVVFVRTPRGAYQIVPRSRNVMDLVGLLHDPDRPVITLEDMEEGIAAGAAESGMAGLDNGE